MERRFDAVLFDAGGVLVLPDSAVLGPLLAYYGGDPAPSVHHRAHYAGMKAKADVDAGETFWSEYNAAYVVAVGIAGPARAEAAAVLAQTRSTWLWREPIPSARESLHLLSAAGIPIGVVSNASGQIEGILARGICQVGAGPAAEVRCIIDSHVVGVAKPDPAIFDHALVFFDGIERERIAYVGDSVTMDIGGATAAGLHPILMDPFGDHEGEDFERITSVRDLVDELIAP